MKVFKPGYSTGRAPQNIKTVPWMQVIPMKLRNEVSSKGEKSSESVCLQEMALMYTCLKNADFRDKSCMDEITSYRQCVFKTLKEREELKNTLKAGKLTPNTKEQAKLNFRQLNVLLNKYPQFNK